MKFIDLSDGKYYMIRCSDWSAIVESENEEEACTQALKKMLDKYGKYLKLSSVMISHHLEPDAIEEDYDDLISYHSVSRMLANAGLHDLSSNVKLVFGA
jgi:predicted glycosyltransferase